MLLLSVFLVSCCLPGSMGVATEEFGVNLKDLLALVNKETFIQVPAGKFQCSHVPCQLNKTIEELRNSFKNDQIRGLISLLEKKKDHIISALNTGHTEAKDVCDMKSVRPRDVRKHFKRYFQNLQENCLDSW